MRKKIAKIAITLFLAQWVFASVASAGISIQGTENQIQDNISEKTKDSAVHIYFFEQDRCGHCRAEKEFFNKYLASDPYVHLVYYDVAKNKEHWQHGLSWDHSFVCSGYFGFLIYEI